MAEATMIAPRFEYVLQSGANPAAQTVKLLFLGTDKDASFTVLRGVPELKQAFGLPLLISVSRKSFLRRLTGRAPLEAGAASVTAELFAALRPRLRTALDIHIPYCVYTFHGIRLHRPRRAQWSHAFRPE